MKVQGVARRRRTAWLARRAFCVAAHRVTHGMQCPSSREKAVGENRRSILFGAVRGDWRTRRTSGNGSAGDGHSTGGAIGSNARALWEPIRVAHQQRATDVHHVRQRVSCGRRNRGTHGCRTHGVRMTCRAYNLHAIGRNFSICAHVGTPHDVPTRRTKETERIGETDAAGPLTKHSVRRPPAWVSYSPTSRGDGRQL